ncbi:unnamed protein product [Echinostoma caproni]|uniref:B box-type domain-containing protein n=1 Tax=Echinostoma caproni TaxID=27848 RepID=A0A183AV84_9TREM|nr:unnamed protein product [Echinostoma caproni]
MGMRSVAYSSALADSDPVKARLVPIVTYVEEAKIDSACGHVDLNPEKESNKDGNDIDSDDDDELPWCFMCEEDATIRCVQCEGLLCDRCLKKSHRKKEFKHHTLVPYKPKKKTND